jgi:hypothetical protein
MYFLAVIPQKMESAGYDKDITFTVTVRTAADPALMIFSFSALDRV